MWKKGGGGHGGRPAFEGCEPRPSQTVSLLLYLPQGPQDWEQHSDILTCEGRPAAVWAGRGRSRRPSEGPSEGRAAVSRGAIEAQPSPETAAAPPPTSPQQRRRSPRLSPSLRNQPTPGAPRQAGARRQDSAKQAKQQLAPQ